MSAATKKWVALTLMLVQNAGFVLVMRYSRKQQAQAAASQYNVSFVVTLQEFFKAVICFVVEPSSRIALTRPKELARIAVPAVCFVLQNNILYVALSNLDPLLFQITYQIKTLLTALFSVALLGKTLTRIQWISQLALMAGIVLVQLADASASKSVRSVKADIGDVAPPQAMAGPAVPGWGHML